ncbi:hypothetical protein C8Q79DRAFT_918917, partial [Trametes meyenii]
GLTPNHILSESQHMPDKGDSTMQKVDAAFFKSGNVPTDHRPHWADQVVAVEFKTHDTSKDPFDDRPKLKVDPDAVERKKVRGQIIEYAEQIFRYQQRTALFMLLIIGRRFRFLRWDRSGTITTRAVDYYEQPDVLCEMLWRMSHLTEEQLGHDPSVKRVLPGDVDYTRMQEVSRPQEADVRHDEGPIAELPDDGQVFQYVRQAFARSLDPNWPRYCLDVPCEGETRTFLVGKPEFFASGMAGRGTRGYVALDREHGHFIWLKDAWRSHYELVEQEGSVLARLNDKGVLNVPTLLCHGDILNQTTRTPEFWELTHPPLCPPHTPRTSTASPSPPTPPTTSECPLRRHKHYRLVIKEVALKLSEFRSGRQLVSIIYDCVTGTFVVGKARVIHRDVSGGNILILPKALVHPQTGRKLIKWIGLLADWELSKPVHEKDTTPRARQPERTGTWQYMSVAVLSDLTKPVETSDELESFFHVLLYNAVRYLRSNFPVVGTFIEDFFDTYSVDNGEYTCGSLKETTIRDRGRILLPGSKNATKTELRFGSPLDDLLDKALQWFKAHYTVQAYRSSIAVPPSPDTQRECSPSPSGPSNAANSFEFICWDLDTVAEESEASVEVAGVEKTTTRKPTAKEEEDALKATTHTSMISALVTAIKSSGWSEFDRATTDNVPPEYKPQRCVGPARCASIATFKRRRMEAQTCPAFSYYCDLYSSPSTPSRKASV